MSGSCVRTWGSKTSYCDASIYHDYDPYQLHLNATNYPFGFLQRDGTKNEGSNTIDLSLAPDLSQHRFAMWSYDYGNSDMAMGNYPAGRFNSGEDVQSFASVTWYPFLSDVVDKKVALKSFDGHYVANALASVLETPVGSEILVDRMKHVALLSIYLGDLKNIKKNKEYLSAYTTLVGEVFGARSKATHRLLLSLGIKSYFSACLTLTTNMQGAMLDPHTPQCSSMMCKDLVFPRPPSLNMALGSQNSLQNDIEEPLILMVDVVDENAVPTAVKDKALHFSANIPRNFQKNLTVGYLERMNYAYRLLSMYANRAKVVVTSRIHVGLPAAALGVPVIFVEKGNWLPGGKQSVGRVEGLLEVFHRVNIRLGQNWTFGDLQDEMPPNPGNHLADRYRASFWNRLKRQSDFYADAAKLFGMVPLQRLGKKMIRDDLYSTFHVIWEKDSHPSWHARRAMEHIFYFHPNAKLYVHGTSENEMVHPFLETLAESGYDLEYRRFDPKDLAEQIIQHGMTSHSSEVLSRKQNHPILVTWKYGGVFVSPGTHLTKELPLTLGPGVVKDSSGEIALLILAKKQPMGGIIKGLIEDGDSSSAEKESFLKMNILPASNTKSCMEDPQWVEVVGMDDSFGVVVDQSAASNSTLLLNSPCFNLLQETCIFCDEINWEFSLGNSLTYLEPTVIYF